MKWIIDRITVTVGGGSVKIERIGLLVSQVQHDNFMAQSHQCVDLGVDNIGWQLDLTSLTSLSP